MSDRPTNEEIVRRYATASVAADLEALAGLRHPDWRVEWPQSGERVHGHHSWAEVIRNYPGGAPRTELTRIVGSEDRWVVTAANTIARVVGSGDFWWSEYRTEYPDGQAYLVVGLIELRDGAVYRETVYWAAPFEAPAWRAPWVDHGEPSGGNGR